jgi:hypothetical protein
MKRSGPAGCTYIPTRVWARRIPRIASALVIGLVLHLCLAVPMLMAQTSNGRIQGTVRDSSGAVIPGVGVTVRHIETGNTFTGQTNTAGLFVFPSLQTGRYAIIAEMSGFEPWRGELELSTGQDAALDAVLGIAGSATQITVAGDVTPLLVTANPTLSSLVERQRIEELPLNGRFFQNLLTLTTPGLEVGQGANSPGTPQPYGLRDGSVQFVQDGVSITDANVSSITSRPPGMDSIQELRVVMSVPPARYSAPATTIVSTRSGTNEWHGGLFHTGRNNGFGVARQRQDFYARPPQLIRNEYGATLGGPVRIPRLYNGKDRTFFFIAWEASNLRSAASTGTSLPTAAMRQGDFSQLTDAQGRPIVLYDPWTTQDRAQQYARLPFPGNVIPAGRRSPLATYFFSVLPQETQPGVNPSIDSNWFGPDPMARDDWTYTLRVDHRLSDRDQLFGRYTIGNHRQIQRRLNQSGPVTLDEAWNLQSTGERVNTGTVTWNHSFSPTFFVETVGAVARMDWQFSLIEQSARENIAEKLGVANPFNLMGAPNLRSLGWSMVQLGASPRAQDTKPVTGEQNYTLVSGKHSFEFGWRFQRMFLDVIPDHPGQSNMTFDSQATGLYDPATGAAYNSYPRTGYNMANFFLGVAGSHSQTLPAPHYKLRSNQLGGYVQDNWRVARGLTLNLGLRYEYFEPLLDRGGVNAVFDFRNRAITRQVSTDELIRAGATTQAFVDSFERIGVKFNTPREAGLPDSLVNVSQANFGPRVGFAWEFRRGGKPMVLRGGYGEYRFALLARLFNVQRGNPPLQGTISYNINAAAQTPDGLPNYGLRSAPAAIAGTPSGVAALRPDAANAVPRGVTINTFAPELKTSLAREWNLTFETDLGANTIVRLAYVGTAGRNLEQNIQTNGQPNNYIHFATTGLPLPTGAFAPVARRSYDQTTYGNINVYSTTGYSNFNGAQAEVQRRFSKGIAFQWFYVMSNAMWVGSGGQILGGSSIVPDPVTFFPGSVPTGFDEYNRFLNYRRNPHIPKHRMNWNLLFDVPVGRGKALLPNAGGFLNKVVGGWQIAAYSTMSSRYMSLPTGNWGELGQVEVYGRKYPVEDCRSGRCFAGYLYYNGYIPANQINSVNAQGAPNGVMGVPAQYKPAHQPIWPAPATTRPSDPNASLYDTNIVFVPMANGTPQRVAYDNELHPWRNQLIPAPWQWQANGSLFKVVNLTERVKLRFNVDAFN